MDKKTLQKVLRFLELLLVLVAVGLLFTPFVKYETLLSGTKQLNGLQIAFGYKVNDDAVVMFSIMNLINILLVVLAVVGLALRLFTKKLKKIAFADFIIFGILVVAAVFTFLANTFTIGNPEALLSYEYKLAAGAIVNGVLLSVAALSIGAETFLLK